FVEGNGRIGCTDPNGLAIRLQVTRKRTLDIECSGHNTWQTKGRINKPAPIYDRATPIEVGHVVFFVKDVNACEAFYHERFGFQASDR
ncbi:glyoxalase, partial [Klebsiella pneumoniae]|nr:glyoxalase [Klebsiella pneumoniae]